MSFLDRLSLFTYERGWIWAEGAKSRVRIPAGCTKPKTGGQRGRKGFVGGFSIVATSDSSRCSLARRRDRRGNWIGHSISSRARYSRNSSGACLPRNGCPGSSTAARINIKFRLLAAGEQRVDGPGWHHWMPTRRQELYERMPRVPPVRRTMDRG